MKYNLFIILISVCVLLLPKDLQANAYVKLTIDGNDAWVPIKGTVSDGDIFTLSRECIDRNLYGEIDLNYIRENNDGTGASYKIKNISNKAFWYCGINSVIIPDDIEYIGNQAFVYCTSLKAPKIPYSCRTIGYDAFLACNSIDSLIIPEGVIDIGEEAFKNCKKLCYLELPSTIKRLRTSIIKGCNKLTSIELKPGLEIIDGNALEGYLTSLILPETVKEIGAYLFGLNPYIKSLTFKGVPEKIDDSAFTWVGKASNPCKLSYPKEWSLAKWIVPSIAWYGGYFDLVEEDETGISATTEELTEQKQFFTLDGKRISNPQKGVNIVRMPNGRTKKMIK